MKKYISFISLFIFGTACLYLPQVHAAELKKSCIKVNPYAAGETDPTLIDLYQQLCDKSAKKNIPLQHELNTQIAKRYVELGSHLKALNLIDQLHRQQQYNQTLTDLSFMAGIAISSNALQQMRSTEVRALNETTYPQAKLLAENIQFAKPALAPVEFKSHTVSNTKNSKKQTAASTKRSTTTSTKTKNVVKSAPIKKTENISTRTNTASSNPFGSLKNN